MTRHFQLSKMQAEAKNIFELDAPDEYHCRVERYRKCHSWLAIGAHKKTDSEYRPVFMLFGGVRYFEGPMWWDSANFCLAPFSEYIAVLSRCEHRSLRDAEADVAWQENLPGNLIIVRSDKMVVKIVAHLLALTDDPNEPGAD